MWPCDKKREMEVDVSGRRISSKHFWHADKVVIILNNKKRFEIETDGEELKIEEKEREI
jgi:hypothetical protein